MGLSRRAAAIALGLIAVVGCAGTGVYLWAVSVPDVAALASLAPKDARARPDGTRTAVRATFLGVATVLFDDGTTQILIDGFLSRPSLRQIIGSRITSDEEVVVRSLQRAGVQRLAAVIVTHSHYDHALDCALVARRTGAVVIGSASTANIARGGDVPEAQIRTPSVYAWSEFGSFRVALVPSGHVGSGYPQGTIEAPLRQPARADAYKLGAAYAVLIEHEGRRILVNASAGSAADARVPEGVETVFLGVGMLGRQSDASREDYWRTWVDTTTAKHVVAIHWDNFARPLDEPLQPLPRLLDDLPATLEFLARHGRSRGVDLTVPQAWQVFDAFAPAG